MVISLLMYILFKIISIVYSDGTFVNNDTTSKDTILYPSGTFCFWMYLTNSFVLVIVYFDFPNGANKLAKYFANSYVAVPILDIIGLSGKSSRTFLDRILLAPLGKSKYTITNTKEFVKYIQKQKVPDGYKMVSFDVVSLFTNVPSE